MAILNTNWLEAAWLGYNNPTNHSTCIFNAHNSTTLTAVIWLHNTSRCTWTYANTKPFYGPLSGTTGWAGTRRDIHSHTWNILWEFLNFMKRGEDNRGKCTNNPTQRHPIQTIDAPTSSYPNFILNALPTATLPIYPGLGQAPNMLDCIPGDLTVFEHNYKIVNTHTHYCFTAICLVNVFSLVSQLETGGFCWSIVLLPCWWH